jgi:hypothetical protein
MVTIDGTGRAARFRVDPARDTGCKRQMRLSRLGTDGCCRPITKIFDAV